MADISSYTAKPGESMVLAMKPLIILLVLYTLIASSARAEGLTAAQVGRLRALANASIESAGAPGMTLAVGLPGGAIWSEGFGEADLESGTPATAESAYRSASIGKPMTAVAAVRLAAQGRLDLDVPVQTYCPRYPAKPWAVTTRQLLNHTAGIRHYVPQTAEAETYLTRHYADSTAPLEIFADDPLLFQPGHAQSYSTWGYVLVGCVIEGAVGGTYLEHMRREVFNPAGMTVTRDDDPRAIIFGRAGGYVMRDGILRNAGFADMSGKLAAGGFITTAPDLVRFGQAFSSDDLLVSATDRNVMLADTEVFNGDSSNYGLGWLVIHHRGLTIALHGGATPGVTGILAVAPSCRVSVAALFNLEGVQDREALVTAVLDIVLTEGEGQAACPAA